MQHDDPSARQYLSHFASLVESVGVKRFASSMNLSTRQINRMLSGAQPNPVDRIIRSLEAASPDDGDRVLDYICQELGGHFVRHESIDEAAVNAVKECAEAIAAISDGHVSRLDMQEIREAISALSGLILAVRNRDGGAAATANGRAHHDGQVHRDGHVHRDGQARHDGHVQRDGQASRTPTSGENRLG